MKQLILTENDYFLKSLKYEFLNEKDNSGKNEVSFLAQFLPEPELSIWMKSQEGYVFEDSFYHSTAFRKNERMTQGEKTDRQK